MFNFYKPDYSPPGLIGDIGLVAPEAELATTPYLIGLLNGLRGLVLSGLTSCNEGLGSSYQVAEYQSRDLFHKNCRASGDKIADAAATSDGRLGSSLPLMIPQALSMNWTLLTGGRMHQSTKEIITEAVSDRLRRTQGHIVAYGEAVPSSRRAQKPSFCAENEERHEVLCCRLLAR